MRLRAALSLLVLLSVLGCTHAVKNTCSPAGSLPQAATAPHDAIEPAPTTAYPPVQSPAGEEPLQPLVLKTEPTYGIDFESNYKVQQWVDRLSGTDQRYFKETLYRFDMIRPKMEEIFLSSGLPKDLVYLSLVESGGNPNAISSAGATGYWQFMSGTARRYGLRINPWIDERRDLEKSTVAAAEYLKHLYSLFDDWLLASAAYNAGEGTINRIMKRHPDITCFWDISDDMSIKSETLAYVPKFTATLILARNRQQYGLQIHDPDRSPYRSHDTITVNTFTYLDEIAEILGVPDHDLAQLNPELIRGCTPPATPQYKLKIPPGTAGIVSQYLSSIHDPRVQYITHTISSGDTLSALAHKYSSTIKNIAQANRIAPGSVLTIGKVLVIPKNSLSDTPRSKHTHVVARGDTIRSIAKTYRVSTSDILAVNNLDDPGRIYPNMVLNIPPKPLPASNKRLTQYRVKKGDTIWGISKQFAVSTHDVMRWNQLTDTAQIYPGDEITIYHR